MAAAEKNKDPWQKRQLNSYARYSGIAIQTAVVILGGTWLGYKADIYWNTRPWLTTIGAMVSLSIALYWLIISISKR